MCCSLKRARLNGIGDHYCCASWFSDQIGANNLACSRVKCVRSFLYRCFSIYYIRVPVCFCLSISVCLIDFLSVYMRLPVGVSVFVFLSICVWLCLFFFCLPVCRSVYMRLYVCLLLNMSVHMCAFVVVSVPDSGASSIGWHWPASGYLCWQLHIIS